MAFDGVRPPAFHDLVVADAVIHSQPTLRKPFEDLPVPVIFTGADSVQKVIDGLNLMGQVLDSKATTDKVIANINIQQNRFGFEPEVTAKLARVKNVRIYEVGISYYGRTYSEGKKIGWKDGFRAIWCILKYGL